MCSWWKRLKWFDGVWVAVKRCRSRVAKRVNGDVLLVCRVRPSHALAFYPSYASLTRKMWNMRLVHTFRNISFFSRVFPFNPAKCERRVHDETRPVIMSSYCGVNWLIPISGATSVYNFAIKNLTFTRQLDNLSLDISLCGSATSWCAWFHFISWLCSIFTASSKNL